MRIDILTLFPHMCREALAAGVVGRALDRGLARVVLTDFRLFAGGRQGTVDDSPVGGGAGMVLRPEPAVAAVESVRVGDAPVVLTSPAGRPFRQVDAEELAGCEQVIFLCGRYKGFDERVRQLVVTHEYSLGDFVISGGELAALAMVDATVRLLPGALGRAESAETDSFGRQRPARLDAAWYSRPVEYRGLRVPEALLSGDHAAIDRWRERDSEDRTRRCRPDLMGDEPAPGDGR